MVSNTSKILDSREHITSLAQLLFQHGSENPALDALVLDDTTYTYAEIIHRARILASYLKDNNIERLGIMASRKLDAYIGILAAHWVGAAYIPLHHALPAFRLKKIIEKSQLQALISDPTAETLSESKNLLFITIDEIKTSSPLLTDPVNPAPDALAYIIFTSGSSGAPKGVPITFGNLSSFITAIKTRYSITSHDRVAQFSNLSFDVSIFDMCMAWGNGAALYVVPHNKLLMPADFIRDNQLTVWISVPSVISIMDKLNSLKPNYFLSLKYSLFTGEALIFQHAAQWRIAAAHSEIENLYGPTEATIDCLAQKITNETKKNSYNDIVPIGKALSGVYAALVDDENTFLLPDAKGELVLAGQQLASGYLQEPELTQEKFVTLTHPEWGTKIWYRTGDYCYQDAAGIFHYLYRLDNQCKIQGHRIELNEIEYYLRKIAPSSEVAVFIIPSERYPHSQIIAVVNDSSLKSQDIKIQLKKYLPDYMLPEQIIYMENFIYNENGKLNRQLVIEKIIEKIAVR
jgi:D-alanine--poly(phosphoribitol) ligase subunit 1